MPEPTLTRLDPPGDPRGVVLILHGGKPGGRQAVDARSASWRRMAAIQRAISPVAADAGVATWLLRYRERGWNGGAAPIQDARWALEEVRRHLGAVPVVLLGHSMGGRTAVQVADDPAVTGVVALAPWWDPADPIRQLAGRHLRAAHGSSDKITSARLTRGFLGRAAPLAASVDFRDMGRVGHYMLRHVGDWNDYAADTALSLMDGVHS